jgi:hypothetical protein
LTDIGHLMRTCPKSSKHSKFISDRITWMIQWRAYVLAMAKEFFPDIFDEVENARIDRENARLHPVVDGRNLGQVEMDFD